MDEGDTTADRLTQALEVFDFGVDMMRASLRRRHPDATPADLERMLDAWLAERPGAETGDAPGTPVPLSRFR